MKYKVYDRVMYEGKECIVASPDNNSGGLIIKFLHAGERGWGQDNHRRFFKEYNSMGSNTYWSVPYEAIIPLIAHNIFN